MPADTIAMPEIASGLDYAIGGYDAESWHRVLAEFEDANIFQTAPFTGSVASDIERLVVKEDGKTVAAAQVRLIRVPVSPIRIAYVFWGPVYKRRNHAADVKALDRALHALRAEYAEKRGLSVRIIPAPDLNTNALELQAYERAGYAMPQGREQRHTVLIDLTQSLEDLRKGLDKKWRNCLNSAERNSIELRDGDGDELFEQFLVPYRQMLARKKISEGADVRQFRAAQAHLPDRFKLKVIIALENGAACAGGIFSAVGNTGIYHFGATADAGTRNKASYLVQWRAVQWLKDRGCTQYDLHGTNAEANPGVYSFKMGLCGRNGREIDAMPNFEVHGSSRSEFVLKIAETANQNYKKLKLMYGRYRGFAG